MSDDKKAQQTKSERKIKDEHFKPSTTKTVMRNNGVSDQKSRIDTYERKKFLK